MRLITDRAKWSMDSEGDWVSFRVDRGAAQSAAEGIQGEKVYEVEIKERKRKRSLDANAYFWVLAGKLASHYNTSPEEVYRRQIQGIGGNTEIVCVQDAAVEKLRTGWTRNGLGWVTDTQPSKIPGCTCVVLYYGSSVYDTRQMSQLIDRVVQECRDAGIETLTPDKLDAMKGRWR